MVGYYKISKDNRKKLPKDSVNVEEKLYDLVCPLVIEDITLVPDELLLLYNMFEIPIVYINDYNGEKDIYEIKYGELKKIQEFFRMNESIEKLEEGSLGHLLRVGKYAYDLACELKLSEKQCRDIYLAAIFHDTGKYLIPDEIVGKQGKLDNREYRIMKKHTDYAYDILHNFLDENILNTIISHHERVDGSGYPKGEIPDMSARILGIADSFDTMISDRVYKKGKSVREALYELIKCSKSIDDGGNGELFDKDLVERFVNMKKERF